MAVPKTIFQTISSAEQLLPEIDSNIEHLKKSNANWEYQLFFDDDRRQFILSHYGNDFLDLYDSIGGNYGACRADFFRYLLMYEVGGVYLDIKSTCTTPLDDIIGASDDFLLSYWRNDLEKYRNWGKHPAFGVPREFQTWHIICSPKHPFLYSVIEHVRSNLKNYNPFFDGAGKLGVWKTTGPIAYSQAILPILSDNRFRIFDAFESGMQYSLYGTQSEHHRLSKTHYSQVRTPIVERRGLVDFLWTFNQLCGVVNEKKWIKTECAETK